MYVLHAVIARHDVLAEFAVTAKIVRLDQDVALAPLFREVAEGTLAKWSSHGTIAHVEAEFFGGWGTQAAQVWDRGQCVLGPLEMDSWEAGNSPISLALRRLGVNRGTHVDEFDALGLGRHRSTEDWLSEPE